jgi:carboxyl-terminal processing protease
MKIFFKIGFCFAFISTLFVSCDNKVDTPHSGDKLSSADSIYWFVDELMKEWYLWTDSIPGSIKYLSYSTPQDLMNAEMISMDHWSFVDKISNVTSYFEEGQEFGYGFYLAWDSSDNLRVIFSYPHTDADTAGIERGCIIDSINNQRVQEISSFDFFFSNDPDSARFSFVDSSGIDQKVVLKKKIYNMKAVLFSNIYEINGEKVGYLVFQSFLGYSSEELKDAITTFRANNIKDIVIDLRYNTGGYISIAKDLCDMLAPKSDVGSVLFRTRHNKYRSPVYDSAIVLRANNLNLNLDRVMFITNDYTASASELVINSLKPYMDVKTIGKTTYGKPVGMYGFTFQDWVVYPVTVKMINAAGVGDYFNGIPANREVTDESSYYWGDLNEPALHQALYYIANKDFDQSSAELKSTQKTRLVKGSKLNKNFLIMDR